MVSVKNLAKRLLSFTKVLLISLPMIITPQVARALSADQKAALDSDAKYFNTFDYADCTLAAGVGGGVGAGAAVYVLGDSITVRSADVYSGVFQQKGVTALINASTGRSLTGAGSDGDKLSGLDAIRNDKAVISNSNVKAIVVALGTNGGTTTDTVTQTITTLRANNPTAKLYWIDTTVINRADYVQTIKLANEAIYAKAGTLDYRVIPWFNLVTPGADPINPTGKETDDHGYIVNGDQHVHPTPTGITALVNLVSSTVISGVTGTSSTVNIGGCSCGVGAQTQLLGNDNIEKIYNYLRGKQLSPDQAAGIMGNMQAESGFNPSKVEIAYSQPPHLSDTVPPSIGPHGEPGYGLVQWTSPGRKAGLVALATSTNRAQNDLGLQLDYLWQELNSPTYKARVLDPIIASTSYVDATTIFLEKFEVPGDIAGTKPGRINNAKQILDHFNPGGGVPSGGDPVVSIVGSGGCSSVTAPGQDTKYVDGFTVYSQFDPAWKDKPYGSSTIGESGCGPSAMAMIITALTGTAVTPLDTATYAASQGMYIPGVGSSWNVAPVVAKQWGLKATKIQLDYTQISTVLMSGGLVIVAGGGPLPFTTNGHYIVIRGITADGKFKIGDSGHSATSDKDWDASSILLSSSSGSIYAITK